MKLRKALYFLTLLTTISCGGSSSSNNDSGSLPLSYSVLSNTSLTQADSNVSGSGSLVFSSPLASVTGESHFTVTSSIEDGGSLKLVVYSDAQLSSGVELLISRSGSTATASVTVPGSTSSTDVSSQLSSVLNDVITGSFTLRVDMHNGEQPGHILVWVADKSATLGDASLSEELGNGAGTYWGLSLNQATVTDVSVGNAQHEDE